MQEPPKAASTTTVLARERTTMAADRTRWAAARTRWAADRTRWADDRTLIAWIRTSLSLIGFGFGVGRALEYIEKLGREADPFHSAKIFGGGFIFLGVLALFAAILQHLRIEKRLRKRGYPRVEPWPRVSSPRSCCWSLEYGVSWWSC
jgi:uncharacterized membrane protein YidH (DUF202 family)